MVDIRPARKKDAQLVKQFVTSVMKGEGAYDPSWPDRDLDYPVAAYAEQNGAFLIAEEGGKIIGTVGFHRVNDDFAILRRFYVSPRFRGKGIGRYLLKRIIAISTKKNYSAIITISEVKFERAFKVYTQAGFIVFQSHPVANYFVKYLAFGASSSYPPEKLASMNWIFDWDGKVWKVRS